MDKPIPTDWESWLYVSRQERALLNSAGIKGIEASNKMYAVKLTARPYVFNTQGLPIEFSDWEGKKVDLRFELLERVLEQEFGMAYSKGIPIAMKKGGKWFAIRSKEQGLSFDADILELSEEQANSMLCLPEDWETRVGVA